MRGYDRPQSTMLTLVNPEQRVPANPPIRLIKQLAEVALKELSPLFAQMYSEVGRPSIPPERLLKASLLMALYTVRSERMFCEQLDYNLLFRWFLDLNWDEPGFDHSTFSRNRARLMEHDAAGEFFRTVVAEAREVKLTSDEHRRAYMDPARKRDSLSFGWRKPVAVIYPAYRAGRFSISPGPDGIRAPSPHHFIGLLAAQLVVRFKKRRSDRLPSA
jgi:transposase